MSWTQPELEAVALLVGRRTGLSFANRADGAELGIRRAMARAGTTDPQRYLDVIAADDQALDDLVGELTIGETYFFREPGQFQMIRRRVLPEVRQRRGPDHVIRAWSAGCASGEEAYSLAILFEEEGLGEQGHLLATDISLKALAKARQAIYGEWSLRGEKAPAARPYLVPQRSLYRLDERMRRRVSFAPLNLALDVYPSFAGGTWGMDLILCRNVLIYFDREMVVQVGRRLYQALAEGGWLVTAAADPPLWDHAVFEVVATDEGVFYRRPVAGQPLAPVTQSLDFSFKAEISRDLQAALLPFQAEPTAEGHVGDLTCGAGLQPAGHVGNVPHDEARLALAQGEYHRVLHLTRDYLNDVKLAPLHVRALANIDLAGAELACSQVGSRYPLSAELNFLHAVLLLELGREEEAAAALRRVLYLDRSLAIAHFTLGSLLRSRGDLAGARRAYRNARDLCRARPAGEVLPLADGEPAGRLAETAACELALLEAQRTG